MVFSRVRGGQGRGRGGGTLDKGVKGLDGKSAIIS